MITSVYIDTDELVYQLHSVSDDAQKALEWVRSFRDTLIFGSRIQKPLPFAIECMAMSEGFSASGVLGKLRAAARKRLNEEGVDPTAEAVDAEVERTQGADAVREIMTKIDRANRIKVEVKRRKFTASAATSDGVDESTTKCNHYDQETAQIKISTNSPAATGVNFDSRHTISPDASDGNAEEVVPNGSTTTKNVSRSVCTSGTSGRTIDTTETLDKAGAGEVPPENVSAKPSPALPVISFGEFGNIKMTNMQYAKLCERFSIADSVLAEADQYFEAQPAKKKKYKNHFAMLLNWCKRRETEAKPQKRYKNINDINRETYEKAKREIHAMFHPEEAKAV